MTLIYRDCWLHGKMCDEFYYFFTYDGLVVKAWRGFRTEGFETRSMFSASSRVVRGVDPSGWYDAIAEVSPSALLVIECCA